MGKKIFREGGPNKIRRVGQDKYTMTVPLPKDADGRVARECPDDSCSPGYFKVKEGTGITAGQREAFCPYCRKAAKPDGFPTKAQIRYAKDLVVKEAHQGVERMICDALGIGPSGKKSLGSGLVSVEMSHKPGRKPAVRRPYEEELRRDVVCPKCGLDQSVYGLAVWCADCGEDIFLTHVRAELEVLQAMLSDVDRRHETLGRRVSARDLENCLEDTVSIFEVTLRTMARQYQIRRGDSAIEIEKFFKKTGNAFQNIQRSKKILSEHFEIDLLQGLSAADAEYLARAFEKRHPITHNLGVVDKKYIERVRAAEKEGREILISAGEISRAIELSFRIFESLHTRMFGVGK